MIEKINLANILFLDIETVPETADYSSLDAEVQTLWDHKTQYQRKDDISGEDFYDRAGIWADSGGTRAAFEHDETGGDESATTEEPGRGRLGVLLCRQPWLGCRRCARAARCLGHGGERS